MCGTVTLELFLDGSFGSGVVHGSTRNSTRSNLGVHGALRARPASPLSRGPRAGAGGPRKILPTRDPRPSRGPSADVAQGPDSPATVGPSGLTRGASRSRPAVRSRPSLHCRGPKDAVFTPLRPLKDLGRAQRTFVAGAAGVRDRRAPA